jgi:acyl carrier protein
MKGNDRSGREAPVGRGKDAAVILEEVARRTAFSKVSLDESFDSLGLTSLAILEIVTAVERRLGYELDYRVIHGEQPNVGGLVAAFMRSRRLKDLSDRRTS